MIRSPGFRLRLGLTLGFATLFAVCVLAAWTYMSEAGRHLGADYPALTGDIVRAQAETADLRLALEDLAREPGDARHRERVETLLWLMPERMDAIRRVLARTELAEAGQVDVLDALRRTEDRLATLEASLTPPDAQLEAIGQALEADLAWAYSSLLDRVHRAAAAQQRLMKRLSIAVGTLIGLVLMVAGALMLALARLHRQWRRLSELSVTDPLTGLANRRRLWDLARHHLARHRRDGGELALLLIDLDHFKAVNDRFGHPAGDAALQAFAEMLRSLIRGPDLVARLGGEEFAVLLPDSGLPAARRLGERLRRATAALDLPPPADGHVLTASLGLSATRAGAHDMERLYALADAGLYRAKQGGRNRLEINEAS
ncbi:GGDEF domain-containing protein [Halomonas koreensis]|uniref:diguanylate cyclase n=1 Tax=Halomonas koreensis TaxID=245385 RepID=A0ABU1G270_9GAMM|nr:GGDEF domain-containing protein [Halomonas koreensis]MDR5867032.1 GGDEF domain-containing protein [Halomonas koreensis]